MLARAALRSQTRDHLDDQVDLVRQQRIEVDEALARQLRQLDVRGEAGVLGEPAAVSSKSLPSAACAAAFFERTRRLVTSEMSDGSRWTCSGKAVHQAGKLDLLVVEAADELAELLLRRDDDPVLPAALYAEALHDGLQIEHLLHVARDELADLVDHEHQRTGRVAALHQLVGALRQLSRA